MSVNKDAVAAVKLTRADAVKLVADEMAEQAAGDVAAWSEDVIRGRDRFREHVIELARVEHYTALASIGKPIRRGVADLHASTVYRVYESGEDSGDHAEVIFSDHPQTYEARFRVALTVQLDQKAVDLRATWLAALEGLKAARERDIRVGAMKKEARDALIKAALIETQEGGAVVAAVKALAATLKGKV